MVTADDVDAKIKDILAKCDLNGDGMISYEGTKHSIAVFSALVWLCVCTCSNALVFFVFV